MAHDIALPNLSSCLALQVRAKYLRGIHLFCACFVHLHSLQIDARFFHSPGLLGKCPETLAVLARNGEHLPRIMSTGRNVPA